MPSKSTSVQSKTCSSSRTSAITQPMKSSSSQGAAHSGFAVITPPSKTLLLASNSPIAASASLNGPSSTGSLSTRYSSSDGPLCSTLQTPSVQPSPPSSPQNATSGLSSSSAN